MVSEEDEREIEKEEFTVIEVEMGAASEETESGFKGSLLGGGAVFFTGTSDFIDALCDLISVGGVARFVEVPFDLSSSRWACV